MQDLRDLCLRDHVPQKILSFNRAAGSANLKFQALLKSPIRVLKPERFGIDPFSYIIGYSSPADLYFSTLKNFWKSLPLGRCVCKWLSKNSRTESNNTITITQYKQTEKSKWIKKNCREKKRVGERKGEKLTDGDGCAMWWWIIMGKKNWKSRRGSGEWKNWNDDDSMKWWRIVLNEMKKENIKSDDGGKRQKAFLPPGQFATPPPLINCWEECWVVS